MITLIDYGMGNLQSVVGGLKKAGAEIRTALSGDDITESEAIVLPGVGAFESGMSNLRDKGIIEPLQDKISEGTPFLGICLGMQLLFSESEEYGNHKGLDIIPGKVKRFDPGLKIPHMGWNSVDCHNNSPLFKGIGSGSYFYFVHSYYCISEDKESVTGTTEYGLTFCSAVEKNNVFGTQFHPEKSQKTGLTVLRNFVDIVENRTTKTQRH